MGFWLDGSNGRCLWAGLSDIIETESDCPSGLVDTLGRRANLGLDLVTQSLQLGQLDLAIDLLAHPLNVPAGATDPPPDVARHPR